MRPELKRYVKNGEDLRFTSHGAFKREETVVFELKLPHAEPALAPAMYIWRECGGKAHRYEMKRTEISDGENTENDSYSVELTMSEVAKEFELEVGLFYFGFDFYRNGKKIRIIQSVNDGLPEFCFDDRGEGAFALTIYERKYPAPQSWYGGIIYHIFVDRFKRSGKCVPKDYAVMNDDWYNGRPQYALYPGAPVANDMFFGGDLWGVAEKLDYLLSLGVNTIYLSPIFDAHSNHKYDTGNFEEIDSMFGGREALEALIKAADERGIGIILDGVFNHTGSDSKYFNKNENYDSVGAYQSEDSKYYKWFSFGETREDYESWWGIKILPRVKSDDADYIDYITGENGIIDTYTSLGISGWRLDVVDELSDKFVENLTERVYKSAEKRGSGRTPIVIGEVWEDASCKIAYGNRRIYFLGKQLDSVMNYPVRSSLIDYLRYGDEAPMMLALRTIWEHYPPEAINSLMNLLGTHDTMRIITALAGDDPDLFTNAELLEKRMTKEQYEYGEKLVKLAYLINATIPGIPSIYYGDEAGMEGYSDPFNRMPFPWGRENRSMLEHFRAVGKIRRENSVYADGELEVCEPCAPGVLVYSRGNDSEKLYTVVNRGEEDAEFSIDGGEVIFSVGKIICGEAFTLKPMSGAIIKAPYNANFSKA